MICLDMILEKMLHCFYDIYIYIYIYVERYSKCMNCHSFIIKELGRGKILQEYSPDGPADPSKPFTARPMLPASSSPGLFGGGFVENAGCVAGVDDVVDDGGCEFGMALDGEDLGEWVGRGGLGVGFEE